ncbi:hypothetical protein [Terriglobus roseus]|uniref:Uncharacterized protein n=1 Tax=Terriglobus roseus TaxID=392734 RepID=A0A1H4LIF0_9BACT|nr:hypothetical protein [Terriglobus roseus]SEB70035.1 hypothetical protein SAMN05443244_1596 [Terriglobus roseus]
MSRTLAFSLLLLSPLAISAQSPWLDASTTLPITFTHSVDASHAKAGDLVEAKTFQQVKLSSGAVLPSGARVTGHVVEVSGYTFDKTPYAKQAASRLSIRFDSVQSGSLSLPLHVTVRAIADSITSINAYAPVSNDLDSRSTRTLVGGDQMYASQEGIENKDGDVVAYSRRDGVYAHLIASGRCDGGSTEVSMGIYSASACGVYGFTGMRAVETGSAAQPSTLTFVSARRAAEVPKHSTALLEVLPVQQASR